MGLWHDGTGILELGRMTPDTIKHFFPVILMGLDLCAGMVYAWYRDWYMAGYWIAAMVITFCASFKP